ncbi:MAG: type II toxin-antitoxin system death-on-curing family toxin [Syntrophorhabdaceae bacterium]
MHSKKRTVQYISRQLQIEPEAAFLILIYNKEFDYLNGIGSAIKTKHLSAAKKCLKNDDAFSEHKTDNKKLKKQDSRIDYNFNNSRKISNNIQYLEKNEILNIHFELAKDLRDSGDPIYPMGVKDGDLLEGAIFFPQTSYGGIYKYGTIESAAAATLYSLTQDHAFHNGNKRTALVSLLVFLDKNNFYITCGEKQLYNFVIKVAGHNLSKDKKYYPDKEVYEILLWIMDNARPLIKGEKIIKLKRLVQILKKHDCIIENNGKVIRKIKSKFLTTKELKTNIPIKHETQDVKIDLMKRVRKDLKLDEENGYDKDRFYGRVEEQVDEYIEKYRKILKRLSKF